VFADAELAHLILGCLAGDYNAFAKVSRRLYAD